MAGKVRHFLLVLSGKGGVGKSTVSVQLSLLLAQQGYKVGLLDIDLCGPSIPYLLGLEGREVLGGHSGWLPVVPEQAGFQNLHVMSLALLLKSRDAAVAWRGPKKSTMIKQLLDKVQWGEIDFLVVDTPPGTSDEHMTVMEHIFRNYQSADTSALIVTTPQGVSVIDVQKEINFCKEIGLKMCGLIENMSGFVCPHCEECTNIFGSGGGKSLAEIENIPYLGKLPLDPRLNTYLSEKKSLFDLHDQHSITIRALYEFAKNYKREPKETDETKKETA